MSPDAEYYSLPYVSQSSLKLFLRSPAEYQYQYVQKQGGGVSTGATSLGSLVHCMLLEPSEVDNRYVGYNENVRPEPEKTMASNLNKAWKASLVEKVREEGIILVQSSMLDVADTMTQIVCAHPLASGLLFPQEEGLVVHTELSILWRSEASELDLKSKVDRVVIDLAARTCTVLDYKTTSATNLVEFGWSVKKYGYDVQAAFYEDAVKSWLEETYPGIVFTITVLFIPQKSAPPYQVLGVCELDRETTRSAREKYEDALRELEGCYHTGVWDQGTTISVLQLSKPLDDIFLPDEELLL